MKLQFKNRNKAFLGFKKREPAEEWEEVYYTDKIMQEEQPSPDSEGTISNGYDNPSDKSLKQSGVLSAAGEVLDAGIEKFVDSNYDSTVRREDAGNAGKVSGGLHAGGNALMKTGNPYGMLAGGILHTAGFVADGIGHNNAVKAANRRAAGERDSYVNTTTYQNNINSELDNYYSTVGSKDKFKTVNKNFGMGSSFMRFGGRAKIAKYGDDDVTVQDNIPKIKNFRDVKVVDKYNRFNPQSKQDVIKSQGTFKADNRSDLERKASYARYDAEQYRKKLLDNTQYIWRIDPTARNTGNNDFDFNNNKRFADEVQGGFMNAGISKGIGAARSLRFFPKAKPNANYRNVGNTTAAIDDAIKRGAILPPDRSADIEAVKLYNQALRDGTITGEFKLSPKQHETAFWGKKLSEDAAGGFVSPKQYAGKYFFEANNLPFEKPFGKHWGHVPKVVEGADRALQFPHPAVTANKRILTKSNIPFGEKLNFLPEELIHQTVYPEIKAPPLTFRKIDYINNEKSNTEFKFGGSKTISNNTKPIPTRGGTELPIGNGMFLLRGNSHEQGGIDVDIKSGNKLKTTDVEAESGEVVYTKNGKLNVLSKLPITDDGVSPARIAMRTGNPELAMQKQESFKRRTNLAYDGKEDVSPENKSLDMPSAKFSDYAYSIIGDNPKALLSDVGNSIIPIINANRARAAINREQAPIKPRASEQHRFVSNETGVDIKQQLRNNMNQARIARRDIAANSSSSAVGLARQLQSNANYNDKENDLISRKGELEQKLRNDNRTERAKIDEANVNLRNSDRDKLDKYDEAVRLHNNAREQGLALIDTSKNNSIGKVLADSATKSSAEQAEDKRMQYIIAADVNGNMAHVLDTPDYDPNTAKGRANLKNYIKYSVNPTTKRLAQEKLSGKKP